MTNRRSARPSTGHRLHVTAEQLSDELSGSLVRRSSRLFELSKLVVLLAVTIITVHSLLATIAVVDGPSMLPTYRGNDLVLVNRVVPLARGDVVILKYPGDPHHHQYIKRIVGLPGETVGVVGRQVSVNGRRLDERYLPAGLATEPEITPRLLGPTEYYTLGDNRPVSNDSRYFGPVDRHFIVGRVWTTLYRSQVVGSQ